MCALPPDKQSLAGGIFNTVIKICSAVGLGITTSIYNSHSTSKAALQMNDQPYIATFWFSVGASALGVCLVPFLTIKTQGDQRTAEPDTPAARKEEKSKGPEGSGKQTPDSTTKEKFVARAASVTSKEEEKM